MKSLSDASIGLVFGTDTGNTEEIGDKIAAELAVHGCSVEMINVIDATPHAMLNFDVLILGIPTWDFGGIQSDWEDFEEAILGMDLRQKVVALYGLGDQLGYGDYFVDAMGWLHERVVKAGATVIGAWPTQGYDFEASLAANADKTLFCGLAVDEDQQIELTDERVSGWIDVLLKEFAQQSAA